MFEVHTIPVGDLMANCHLLVCKETKETIVIDPGAEGERIKQKIEELGLKPILILITHGHGDHIGANGFIKNEYQILIAIHKEETHMLTDAAANLSIYLGVEILSPPADQSFVEGETISFCGHDIQIMETEGHSPMSCSFLIENHLFAGDALFRRSVGRTDFPGGNHNTLIQRIKEKLLVLPDETIVYPGHGPNTTIGEEKVQNPFLV